MEVPLSIKGAYLILFTLFLYFLSWNSTYVCFVVDIQTLTTYYICSEKER